jgi:hypothetical protein
MGGVCVLSSWRADWREAIWLALNLRGQFRAMMKDLFLAVSAGATRIAANLCSVAHARLYQQRRAGKIPAVLRQHHATHFSERQY